MKIPTISHPTDRPNFSVVTVGNFTYWFSYDTCVAFQEDGYPVIVRKNVWGPTTGKHLNYIDNGSTINRVDGKKFAEVLAWGHSGLAGVTA